MDMHKTVLQAHRRPILRLITEEWPLTSSKEGPVKWETERKFIRIIFVKMIPKILKRKLPANYHALDVIAYSMTGRP